MNPLMFIDWGRVASVFTLLMWVVAIILGIVIILHAIPTEQVAPHTRVIVGR